MLFGGMLRRRGSTFCCNRGAQGISLQMRHEIASHPSASVMLGCPTRKITRVAAGDTHGGVHYEVQFAQASTDAAHSNGHSNGVLRARHVVVAVPPPLWLVCGNYIHWFVIDRHMLIGQRLSSSRRCQQTSKSSNMTCSWVKLLKALLFSTRHFGCMGTLPY
jgi:hypothetical protein